MWEFLLLEWRVKQLWSTLLNNRHCSLAELTLRGELDDVFEGIASPEDDYDVCLEKLLKLIDLGKEFLDVVAAEIRGAIAQIRDPYPGVETGARSYGPAVEIPVDEE
jgi:hypothetical protein